MAAPIIGEIPSNETLISDCMHMLRHLRDPAELRRNALVAPLFAGANLQRSPRRAFLENAQRLLGIVRRAIDALREDVSDSDPEHRARQHRILLECDLNNVSRESVMNELGISRRQFYRDRKDACEFVATYVAAEMQQYARPAVVQVDMFAMHLARARTLRHTGLKDESSRALRDLVAQTRSGRKKVTAWFSLVDLLADDNRGTEAAREFQELRMFTSSFADSSVNATELARMMAVQEASVNWALGDERAALEMDARAGEDLNRLARSTDADVRAFTAASHLVRGQRAFLVGNFDVSGADLDRAGELISNSDEMPDAIRMRFLVLDGERKIFTPGAAAKGRDSLALAVRMAQERGFVEILASALDQLALLSQNFDDLQEASRYVRDAVILAEQHATASAHGAILLHAAELAAESGHAQRSIDLAEKGRECFPHRGAGASIAWFHVARGHLLLRAYGKARDAAEHLRENASIGGNRRLLGSALRLLAQAHAGLGEQSAASTHIKEAVDILERFGQPYALRAAYRTSAKITGHAAHMRRAEEIDASFQRTA